MTDSFVQVAPDSTGKKIRNKQVVVGGSTTQQQVTADLYNDDEYLVDQAGAGGVLDFPFSAAVDVVIVFSKGGVSRAIPNESESGAPTATKGAMCDDSVPTYIPRITADVKVWAPNGATVTVWGYRY